jgi:hypothetical protein
MSLYLKQSTAVTILLGPFVDDADFKTPETALTISQADVRLSKNGAAFAQKNDATAATHRENGVYAVPLNATDTDTLGHLRAVVLETGALVVWQDFLVLPAQVYDSLVGSDKLQVDLAEWLGVAPLALTAQKVQTHPLSTGAGAIVAASFGAGAIDATAIATAAIDADAIATGAITAAKFAAGAVDAAALAADASAEIADAVWDEAKAGHVAAGSFGEEVQSHATSTEVAGVQADTDDIQARLPAALVGGRIDASVGAMAAGVLTDTALAQSAADKIIRSVSGTADAGSTATTIVDAERTEATTDYWQHALVLMTSGANVGQIRRVTAFNAATDTLTVAPGFKSAVAAGDTYLILRTSLADGLRPLTEGNERVDVDAAGDVGADVQTWLDAAVNVLQAGRVDGSVGAMAADVVTATAIATDAIGAAEFSQAAADKVWSSATRTLTAFSTALAVSVWDVLETAIAVASSIGLKVKNNLDAAVSTRLAPTVAGRTLDVAAGGEAGLDLDNTVGALAKGTEITGFNDLSAAQVNAEVVDALNVDTYAEPGQEAPPATTTLVRKIGYLYKAFRNRITQSATELKVFADDAVTVDQKATVSDDGTTYTRGELGTGP